MIMSLISTGEVVPNINNLQEPRVLYINGDSHAAGAEAVVPFAFAEDDPWNYPPPNRKPHPENEIASFGNVLADRIGMLAYNDSESASSNTRIIRTTRQWLDNQEVNPNLVLIGWSTWEREEWIHNGQYFQANASGTDVVPLELRDKYKHWVIQQADADRARQVENEWHQKIYEFHLELSRKNINHLFFNTYQYFFHTVAHNDTKFDWGLSYISPYDKEKTYYYYLKSCNFDTVNPSSYHYGQYAHQEWANYLELFLGNRI